MALEPEWHIVVTEDLEHRVSQFQNAVEGKSTDITTACGSVLHSHAVFYSRPGLFGGSFQLGLGFYFETKKLVLKKEKAYYARCLTQSFSVIT